jgi:hypothetical protein
MAYGACSQMSHAEFQDFVRPDNEIGQILQSHFIALLLVIRPIVAPFQGISRRLRKINDNMSFPMRKYIEWPISVQTAAEEIENAGETLGESNFEDVRERQELE